MASSSALVERHDAMAIAWLDRSAQRNAMPSGLVASLRNEIAALDRDPDMRAIVLTGVSKGFGAGSDLAGLAAMDHGERADFQAGSERVARSTRRWPASRSEARDSGYWLLVTPPQWR